MRTSRGLRKEREKRERDRVCSFQEQKKWKTELRMSLFLSFFHASSPLFSHGVTTKKRPLSSSLFIPSLKESLSAEEERERKVACAEKNIQQVEPTRSFFLPSSFFLSPDIEWRLSGEERKKRGKEKKKDDINAAMLAQPDFFYHGAIIIRATWPWLPLLGREKDAFFLFWDLWCWRPILWDCHSLEKKLFSLLLRIFYFETKGSFKAPPFFFWS